MTIWTCPACDRRFGAVNQGHMCQPGLTVDEFLDDSPGFVPAVFHAVHDHLVGVDADADGQLIVDPLASKVLFKNGPTFCILDVKTRWVAIGFSLRRRLETGRLSRKVADAGSRHYHVINAPTADVVDDELRNWLTEAYHHGDPAAADAFRGDRVAESAASWDPMVPDDVDI